MTGSTDEITLWEVLEIVKDYISQTRTLPPVLLNFFTHYFELWDGSRGRDTLFEVLSFAPLHDFDGE